MCRMVVVVVLLLSLGVSNPVRAIGTRGVIPNRLQQQRLAVCGEDARAGLILHQAYDPDDALADPSLALLNPINGVSRPVNVPEPSNSFSAQFACVAFVKTAVGAYYLLDGSTGDAYPLDFMDSAEEWKYVDSAHWDSVGERRYALFATTGIKGIRAFMMDLSKGLSWDLTPLITEEGSMRGSHFSPSGKYLTMTAGGLMDARTWLIPTDDPTQARPISRPIGSQVQEFDVDEERFLYWNIEDSGLGLYVEDIATGESHLVATDPREKDEYDPYLSGWFIPGNKDLIAVLHHDRFALVDISGAEPVERFVIDGHRPFSTFVVAPSGKAGVLDGKPATIFVDLLTGESHAITTFDGTAISSVASYGQRGIAGIGGVDEPGRGYGVIDLETGDFRTIYLFSDGETFDHVASVWASDGSVGLLTTVDANQQRHLSLINNELGTSQPIADAGQVAVTLSADSDRAAFSTTDQGESGAIPQLALIEMSTGTVTPLGPGSAPVWIGP